MRSRITIKEFLYKNWLLVGILGSISVASLSPQIGIKGGPLRPEYTVKYGAVAIIFLISGLSLKTDNIYYAFSQKHIHWFIQLFTFLFIPLYTQLAVKLLSLFGINDWLLKGFITVACMPPPVSSAVVLTRAAHGNETVAIINSVIGSFIGIILTPISLLFNLGVTAVTPIFSAVLQLIFTVLIPLCLGQIIRNYTPYKSHHFVPLNAIGQCALILIIFTTFCDTFETQEFGLSATDILWTVFFVMTMQISLLTISFKLANHFQTYFDPGDVIAIVFCSTHKSLTLGIPILRMMFQGLSHLSQISLPLLVYHPTQIILGGMIVSQLKEWCHRKNKLPI